MYNSEETIIRCLKSVVNQTYTGDIEILVINDGSKDRSELLVNEFINEHPGRNIKLINQLNGGVSKARNAGLKLARGNFMAMLDADDEWLAHKLDKQLNVMAEHSQIDFLGCSRNNEVLTLFSKKIVTLHQATVAELLIKMYPQTSTAIFKRKLYDQLGGYNEHLTHAEDGELWVRFCAKFNFFYLPDSLVITGGGKPSFGHSGLSANLKAMQLGNEFILKEARRNKLINDLFYISLLTFSRIKYLRRILITKNR